MRANELSAKTKHERISMHMDEQNIVHTLAMELNNKINKYTKRDLLIVCIGTDRSTGDSLGPLLGTMLQKKTLHHFHVYGTLQHPIHAVNLEERWKKINKLHPFSYTIAIDACLGRLAHVGHITIGDGPLRPGAAMSKSLPPIGDIHMTGIVNISGMMEFFVLQNTRLFTTMQLADTMSKIIKRADVSLQRRPQRIFFPPRV